MDHLESHTAPSGHSAREDDDELANTLKASDLTAADLAALASLAKNKSSVHAKVGVPEDAVALTTRPDAGRDTRFCHITPSGRIHHLQGMPGGPSLSFQPGDIDNDDFAWASDFEIQNDFEGLCARNLLISGASRGTAQSDALSTETLSEFASDISDAHASQHISAKPSTINTSKRGPSSSISSIASSSYATPSTTSKTGGAPLIIGEMLFDSKRLCWVRRDGMEEEDPFAEEDKKDLGPDTGSQGSKPSLPRRKDSTSAAEVEAKTRLMRRTQSDSPVMGYECAFGHKEELQLCSKACDLVLKPGVECRQRGISQSSDTYREEHETTSAFTLAELQQIIEQAVQGDRSGHVPSALEGRIPAALWLDAFRASKRHSEEMLHFVPRSASVDSAKQSPVLPALAIGPRTSSLPRKGRSSKLRSLARGSKASDGVPAEPAVPTRKENSRASRLYLLRELAYK